MRVPIEEFERIDLRAHSLLSGVPAHDVWAVDLHGGGPGRTIADVRALLSGRTLTTVNPLVKLLFAVRWRLGRVFGWDREPAGASEESWLHRLSPTDFERSLVRPGTREGRFRVLFASHREAVLEIQNSTVHGFSVFALVERASGYRFFWAIYVRPVGRVTAWYMRLIDPFRRIVIYPAVLRHLRAHWGVGHAAERKQDGHRTLRLIAGYGAIATALPYLALKLVWLTGGTIGVADLEMMREPSMVVLNAATAGMDCVGILLALAFTHEWGHRIPAWLLLPPAWVGTGLLATFVVGVPVVALLSAVAPESLPASTGGPVEAWVYALVYIEFAGLGAGLMTAFLLHAKARWPGVFQTNTRTLDLGTAHRVHVALANMAVPVAVIVAGVYLSWAVGLGQERRTIIGSVLYSIQAMLSMAAAAGALIIVHRIAKTLPWWVPLTMAWIGTGSLFGWGLWQTINVLSNTALLRNVERGALVNLVGLLSLLVGLVLGLVTLFALAEKVPSKDPPRAP